MSPATSNVVPLAITPAQRSSIRDKLDEYFDDTAGMYRGEHTDQTIARSINVPPGAVSTIREAAYGPLRADPVIALLKRDIDKAAAELGSIVNKAADLETSISSLRKRADAIESRLRS